jgi:uncharacterized protein GlcG (DUF336 family)
MADTYLRPSITHDLTMRLLSEGLRVAEGMGKQFAFAVVDHAGRLKGLVEQDGVRHIAVQVAQDKAYTALTGRPTHLWDRTLQNDEVIGRDARTAIDRLVTLGGGYPIVVDGAVVGALGVSGGLYTEDMEVAVEVLRTLGFPHEW